MNYITPRLTPYLTRSFGRLAATLVLSAFTLLTAQAQSATASLSGTVTDEQGAVVAKADIKAVNDATNLVRKTTTNTDGFFTLPLLPPGVYSLNVERDGFAPVGKRDLILNVGDQRSLLIQLRVSHVAATINVTDEASLLNESPAVGTVIDRRLVENLPLNGRSFQSLILLAPGVVPVAATNSQFGQFSVNGQRESTNYLTIDGVSANIGISAGEASPFGGGGQYPGFNAVGGTTSLVSVDAVQEFRIQTSTFAPEFGRTPGGQISVVTRSGTNDFRGSVFEYFRNEKLDANDYFANRAGLPKAALRNNQFGGVFGGPIAKDRTFFFASFEALRLRLPQTGIRVVPTVQARQQATGAIKQLVSAFPIPNGQDFGDGTAEFTGGYSEPSSLNGGGVRVDHNFNSKLNIFGRFNFAKTNALTRGNAGSSLSNVTRRDVDTTTFTSGATMIFSSCLINDLRFNYSRVTGGATTELDDFGGAVAPSASTLFPSFTSSEDALFRAYFNNFGFYLLGGTTGKTRTSQYNIVDTLSYSAGSHQLKFGFDYRRNAPVNDYQSYQQVVGFSTIAAAITGNASFAFIGNYGEPLAPRFDNFSLFAQDTWRINQRLTLTYGLRYEINPPPVEKNGNDVRTTLAFSNPAEVRLAPAGTPLWKTTYNNFAPRVGAVYQLRRSAKFGTVFRSGFGVFYDLTTGSVASAYDAFAYPNAAGSAYFGSVAFPFSATVAAPPPITPDPPYNYVYGFPSNLKLPYTLQWNASVEQSVGANQTVTATYLGAAGRRLYRVSFYGSPNANFDNFHTISNDDYSHYNALQIQFLQRLTRGFQALASYTWSHSIDTASTDVNTFSGNLPQEISPVKNDRSSSDFDIRHAFNVAATYNLPKLNAGGFGGAILNGWAIDGIFRAYSAPPVNIITDNQGFGYDVRPDVVPGQPFYIADKNAPGSRRINADAFVIPNGDQQGNFGRNVLRGFATSQVDLSVRRIFSFTENVKLQLRGEVFNVFNRANFARPVGDPNNPFFGQSTQSLNRGLGGLNPVYQIGGPRSIQLGLKLQF